MSDRIVLDASVIVKMLVAEDGSDKATALLVRPGLVFFAPAHALAEVFEALLRKCRRGEIDMAQARAAVAETPEKFFSIDLGLISTPAFEIAARFQMSFYDALYVAAADARDALFVTDDRKLIAKLAGAPHAARTILLADVLASGPGPQ